MQHEDGHCDECGCELREAWLTIDGRELCRPCAISELRPAVALHEYQGGTPDGR